MDTDLPNQPIEKLSISGPTLSSILQSFSSSHGDIEGLLFGHVIHLPPPDLHDDMDCSYTTSAPSPNPIAVIITGHICFSSISSFYDPLGRIDSATLTRILEGANLPSNSTIIGWLFGRRSAPLRPSMRELSVTLSLSRSLKTLETNNQRSHQSSAFHPPFLFLLLSSSSTPNHAIHTHEYRAFELKKKTLVPRSMSLINVGPAFREQYASFAAESAFPLIEGVEGDVKSLIGIKKNQMLDRIAEGFGLDRLRKMAGSGASQYTTELEALYTTMLGNLKSLARSVEISSANVASQEIQNLKLRSKFAGLD
ncbi:hypothetical protein ZOSMA_141G00170 [Zostera marina]|uniref:Uncharacterized protein n=1 Tax=Zostera marina TaxID=29655 RepID=A0A0K9PZW7_ZOSMR|nr:hypothetical protein ZOSMA_141G00170 [Zostera marina]